MSFLSDLIYGVRNIAAGALKYPLRPTVRFVGATVEDVPSTKETLVTIVGDGAAAATRQIIAGAGLQGGGDLTADRTLSAKLRAAGVGGLAIFGDGIGALVNRNVGTLIDAVYGIGVKVSAHGGLVVGFLGTDVEGEQGLGVLLPGSSGLQTDATGLRLKVLSTGGLSFGSNGAFVKLPAVPAGLKVDSNGLDIDTAKVPVLASGKLAETQRAGWVAHGSVANGTPASITSTSTYSSQGIVTPGFNVEVGDIVDLECMVGLNAGLTGNYDTEFTLRTAGTARVTDSIYTTQGLWTFRQRLVVGAGQAGALSSQIRMRLVGAASSTTPNIIRHFLTVFRP